VGKAPARQCKSSEHPPSELEVMRRPFGLSLALQASGFLSFGVILAMRPSPNPRPKIQVFGARIRARISTSPKQKGLA
jgi:hypothetical protein